MQEINLIGKITAGGSRPVMESLSVTENGNYTPGEGVDGFNRVNVNVQPVLETLTATENGVYTPGTGKDGFSNVTVNVPNPPLESLSVTENGVYLPSTGKYGFSSVTVNTPGQKSEGSDYLICCEGNMKIYPSLNGKIKTLWDGGTGAIGLTLNGQTLLSGLSSITCKANITNSYEYNYKSGLPRCQFVYGFTDNLWSNIILFGYNTGDHVQWFHGDTLTNDQTLTIDATDDISDLTGDLYFFVSLLGVQGTFDFTIE